MDQEVFAKRVVSNTHTHTATPIYGGLPSKERNLPVFCPHCGSQIEFEKGLCGNRLIDAILLQAERMGAELVCQKCRTQFVFQRVCGLTDSLSGYSKSKERC